MVENILCSHNFSIVSRNKVRVLLKVELSILFTLNKVAFIRLKIYEQLGRLYGNVKKGVNK